MRGGRRVRSTMRRGLVAAAVAALAGPTLAACGVSVDHDRLQAASPDDTVAGDDFSPEVGAGGGATSTPTTLPPPTDVVIQGDTGSEVNRVAANAIADLNTFWGATYPATFDGAAYQPPAGGYHAVDRTSRPSTVTSRRARSIRSGPASRTTGASGAARAWRSTSGLGRIAAPALGGRYSPACGPAPPGTSRPADRAQP